MFCIGKRHHSNQHISRMHRICRPRQCIWTLFVLVLKLWLVVLKVFEKGNTVTGIFGECIEVQLGCRPRQWICCGSRIRRYCLACGRSSGLGCGALVCLDAIGVGLYLCLYLSFFVSSVRSSNSHPDLLVIQQHQPLFQITPVLNTGL